jgi:hypothetical protein
MAGVRDLKVLLKSMQPRLIKKEFVFCTVPEEFFSHMKIKPLLIFKEEEGVTLILEKKTADENSLPYSGTWALITISVHSDLSAVGFLAAMTKKLSDAGISTNVVSACYHDHLFVPFEEASKATKLLKELSDSA